MTALRSSDSWERASIPARQFALLKHSSHLTGCEFSTMSLAGLGTLKEFSAAVPGFPVEDKSFIAALTQDVALGWAHSSEANFTAPPITHDELMDAKPSPDCIVENYLYADVKTLIAPGGVGKTTLKLHEAICVALGRPVFGELVLKPGSVLFITAEDRRSILVARLRACMDAMQLSEADRQRVMNGVRIADVSGGGFKLTEIVADVVVPSLALNDVYAVAREINPVLIVVDPAISFGVGEARVNDAEQGLIEAARSLRNTLNCAVEYIHHSGKVNARTKTLDQYSGRGGSAFADGARMVHVLQNMTPLEWQDATGEALGEGETGLILARPKMSYCQPPGDIFIRRTGYSFERVEPITTSKNAQAESRANQIWNLLAHELKNGRFHSKNTLEQADAGDMTRQQIRDALAWLEASARIEVRKRPDASQYGAKTYLHPASPKSDGEPTMKIEGNGAIASLLKNSITASPPLRKNNGGEPTPSIVCPVFLGSLETHGEPTANPANRSD